jgi:hypothetical protein
MPEWQIRRFSVRDLDFFKGVLQATFPIGEYVHCTPVFYYDVFSMMVTYVTPLERIRAALPSPVMHPLRITPWHGVTVISAFEYSDTDIGPYNELAVMFPVTLYKPAPVLTGLLKALAEGPMVYIWHLPVTTELARYLGVEHAGFPKFVADIQFDRHAGWIDCRVAEGDSHILTLRVREIQVQPGGRSRFHMANVQNGRILRLEANSQLRRLGISHNPSDVRLELGSHPMAQDLSSLGLGRMMECRYIPEGQIILSQVLESYDLNGAGQKAV